MNRTKRFKLSLQIMLLLFITVFQPDLYAQETSNTDKSWELYSMGLESMLEENNDEAIKIFSKLVNEYPFSDAAVKAQRLINRINNEVDHSGIIPFYLGNMLTTTFVFSSIPLLFDIDDGIVLGAAGIAGVGTGLYSAWLMSSDTDLPLGHAIWIEFIESASIVNFQLAYNLFSEWIPDEEVKAKVNIGGMALTALGSRAVSYITGKKSNPSSGRSFTVANSYLWSQYYLWMILNQIAKSENENLNRSLGIIIPDAVAAGTYFLWESLDWSLQRAGLISISGAGGSLLGIFTNMILEEASGTLLSDQLKASLVLGFALAGKYIGIRLTENMKSETDSGTSKSADLFIMPEAGPDGTGFTVTLRL